MYDVINFKTVAQHITDYTFTDYYYRLMLMARSVFEWKNLPNGIDEKWIEKYLYTEGCCVFFKDPKLGFMVAKATQSGMINNYDEPTKITPYATNYMGEPLVNFEECVLMRNNDIMIPTYPTIQLFAYRLAEISRTIDININAQKTPILMMCSERQKNTLKNLYKQWNGFEPVIYGSKDLDLDGVKALKTDAPVVFDALQIQKHAIWNECMTFLGISNANQDKRERLVTDEVNANNEQIEMSAQIMLKARQKACEQINEMFDLNIEVSLRNQIDLDDFDLEEEMEEEKEVV